MIFGGVDSKFNALRILPPHELFYPDPVKDKDVFWKEIGCPHLKVKYQKSNSRKER